MLSECGGPGFFCQALFKQAESLFMSDKDITLAIPFYGSIAYLTSTLTSIQGQTVSNWCAIVVDDFSPTPGVRELVERFGDPRITYVRNEGNLGLAGNWNRCIDLCRTPLITLVHGDDELMPHYVETMLAAHSKCPDAAAVFCGAMVIDQCGSEVFSFRDYVKRWLAPDPKRTFVLADEQGVRSLLRGNFIICPTLCYKRDLFEEMEFSPEWRMVLDVDLYLRAIAKGKKFVGLRDVAYRYRRHADQTTAECERNLRIFVEEVELWRRAARDAQALGWYSTAKVAENMTIIKLQLLYYLLADIHKLQFGAAWKKLTLLSDIWRRRGRLK